MDLEDSSPKGVHFVGSVPLDSAEEVFTTIASAVPNHIRSIPDGETAERYYFVRWQFKIFPDALKPATSDHPVDPSIAVEDIPRLLSNLETRYDDYAIESYKKFSKLRDAGVIPQDVKFQVSLPTPVNVVTAVDPKFQAAVEPLYEAALLRTLRRIQDEIPHTDLAIQWDCAIDFAMLEGAYTIPPWHFCKPWFDPVEDGVLERIVRCSGQGHVDEDVAHGYHFCYGDVDHKHFCEPKDTGMIAKVIKAVYAGVGRRVNWIHLPVPKDRWDEEYFKPLKEVIPSMVENGTTLYLGLVHAGDEEGTRRRINTAKRVLGNEIGWGVGTECGMGRTPREQLADILDISRKVSMPIRQV